MPEPVSTTLGICLASYTALQAYARRGDSAFSTEAGDVRKAASAFVENFERSHSLFGEKTAAISRLRALAIERLDQGFDGNDVEFINSIAVINAENFLRALPESCPVPEFAVGPDGNVALDWIKSKSRLFSLSIGSSNRLAFAWLDGTDAGHAVATFDGNCIPKRVLEGVAAILNYGDTTLRAA